MAERDLADNLVVSPRSCTSGVRCLGRLCGRRGLLAGERRHVPRLVGSQANALVCLVVHQITDGLAAVSIGQAQLQYGVACLVLDPHGQYKGSRYVCLGHVSRVRHVSSICKHGVHVMREKGRHHNNRMTALRHGLGKNVLCGGQKPFARINIYEGN